MAHNRQSRFVSSAEATLEVLVEGEGPAVVVLPSYGRGTREEGFDAFAERLSTAGFTVIRPQPRGIAGSRGQMGGLSLHDLGRDIAGVIRELAPGKAFLLGHAFGHGVAKTVAADEPPLVQGVILAAAQCSVVPPEISCTPYEACDVDAPTEQRLAALRRGFFAPGHDPRVWLAGWYPKTLQMQVESVANTVIGDISNAGEAPLLEIIPDSDPFKPPAYWGELQRQFGSRVHTEIVTDASHALFPEQPEQVAAIVAAWCRRIATRSDCPRGGAILVARDRDAQRRIR